jgi:FkbM family methyltransferase
MSVRRSNKTSHILKQLTKRFPRGVQQELKRHYFAWKIHTGRFTSEEPEYRLLDRYVHAGDWTLDIGANVGYYTARMSELAGSNGRVLAFEPILESFELLAANSRLFPFKNTTLFNVAVSDRTNIVGMSIPMWDSGGNNYYEAFITKDKEGVPTFAFSIDALSIPERVTLAKIDTEGYELFVLQGMRRLLERDHPVLIVEANSTDTAEFLKDLGYNVKRSADSSNYICHFDTSAYEFRV